MVVRVVLGTHRTGSRRTAQCLVIMIVYKYFGIFTKTCIEIKSIPVVAVTERVLHLFNITEIGDYCIIDIGIFIRLDIGGFTVCPDNLEICRRTLAGDIGCLGKNSVYIVVPHVLGGINSETVNTHAHQVGKIIGELFTGAVSVCCRIRHTAQSTVTNLISV